MSLSKELYINFNAIKSKEEEDSKELRKKLSDYQKKATNVSNTISTELIESVI